MARPFARGLSGAPATGILARLRRAFDRQVYRVLAPSLARVHRDLARVAGPLAECLERMDRPPECWVLARKA